MRFQFDFGDGEKSPIQTASLSRNPEKDLGKSSLAERIKSLKRDRKAIQKATDDLVRGIERSVQDRIRELNFLQRIQQDHRLEESVVVDVIPFEEIRDLALQVLQNIQEVLERKVSAEVVRASVVVMKTRIERLSGSETGRRKQILLPGDEIGDARENSDDEVSRMIGLYCTVISRIIDEDVIMIEARYRS